MTAPPPNLTLVGMPGSGKSTVGRALAERLGWTFLDLDTVVEQQAGDRKLWQIIEAEGNEGLSRREEQAALSLDVQRTVIAPGGSIVYSEPAMRHLRQIGAVVFLDVPLAALAERCGDLTARGVILRPGWGLSELAAHRVPLYRRWATVTINSAGQDLEETTEAVLHATGLGPGGF